VLPPSSAPERRPTLDEYAPGRRGPTLQDAEYRDDGDDPDDVGSVMRRQRQGKVVGLVQISPKKTGSSTTPTTSSRMSTSAIASRLAI
jgi:hypothetical protein